MKKTTTTTIEAEPFILLSPAGQKQFFQLRKGAREVFSLVMELVTATRSQETVGLNLRIAQEHGLEVPERSWRNGLQELVERGFLGETQIRQLYSVNHEYVRYSQPMR